MKDGLNNWRENLTKCQFLISRRSLTQFNLLKLESYRYGMMRILFNTPPIDPMRQALVKPSSRNISSTVSSIEVQQVTSNPPLVCGSVNKSSSKPSIESKYCTYSEQLDQFRLDAPVTTPSRASR